MGKKRGRRRDVEVLTWDEVDRLYHAGDGGRPWQEARDRSAESRARGGRRPERPLTARHLAYQREIEARDVVLCVGPAGTGKTTLACGVAVRLLQAGAVSKIVLSRPLVQCDEELGILPGELKDKMAPYLAPLVEGIKEIVGPQEYARMEAAGLVEAVPLAAMRGRTFHRAFVVVDEAQNATFGQLKMALSRLGHGSKMVVNGDVEQVDLGCPPPLVEVWGRLAAPPRHPGYGFVAMTEEEVLRPDIVRFTTKRLAGPRGATGCESSQPSGTTTTSGPPGPAPSYAGVVAEAARRSRTSSASSKPPAS